MHSTTSSLHHFATPPLHRYTETVTVGNTSATSQVLPEEDIELLSAESALSASNQTFL